MPHTTKMVDHVIKEVVTLKSATTWTIRSQRRPQTKRKTRMTTPNRVAPRKAASSPTETEMTITMRMKREVVVMVVDVDAVAEMQQEIMTIKTMLLRKEVPEVVVTIRAVQDEAAVEVQSAAVHSEVEELVEEVEAGDIQDATTMTSMFNQASAQEIS